MKKICYLLVLVALVFSLASCVAGKGDNMLTVSERSSANITQNI